MVEHRKAEFTRFITEAMKDIWVKGYLDRVQVDQCEYEEAIQQTLGVIISQYCEYTGHQIVTVFLAALEDSNYHTFGKKVKALWNAGHPAFKIQ